MLGGMAGGVSFSERGGWWAVFFDRKARREERWLRSRFPKYAAYERRVRRFIPGIY